MTHETEVLHRHYGTCGKDGHLPHRAIAALQRLYADVALIPLAYQASAEFDCEPDYDCADGIYAAVKITYRRPETTSEAAERIADDRSRLENNIARAEKDAARWRAGLAGLS